MNPGMMTALLFYAYRRSVPGFRQIENKTYEEVAFRVIASNHKTMSYGRMRKRKEELEKEIEELLKNARYFYEVYRMFFEDALLTRFMATKKMNHGEVVPPFRGRPPDGMTPGRQMIGKRSTKRGQEIYSKTKVNRYVEK